MFWLQTLQAEYERAMDEVDAEKNLVEMCKKDMGAVQQELTDFKTQDVDSKMEKERLNKEIENLSGEKKVPSKNISITLIHRADRQEN